MSQFNTDNNDNFISHSLNNTEYTDVFEELENHITQRFLIQQPFDVPISKAPPSSPEIQYIQTTYHNFDYDFNLTYPIHDIQSILNFPKTDLLIFSNSEYKIYQRPPKKSIDARYIWTTAQIPEFSSIQNIEFLLLDWAYTYAYLEISDKTIKKITWTSKTNTKCVATWKSFIRWILCASISQ